MDHFEYRHGELYAEDIPVADIAQRWGTPCYIYSKATLERHWKVFDEAFGSHPHQICYAVKANSNIAILNLFARLGSGFDIVSQGELERVLAAGGNPKKVLFSGVGKSVVELERALKIGVGCFNVESESELYRLNQIAERLKLKAPISLRVNPDINADTHPYIATGLKENKFGIDITDAKRLYKQAASLTYIEIKGISYHIGSQLTTLQPFREAFGRVLSLVNELKKSGISLCFLDIGGGLGVRYENENPPTPFDYISNLRSTFDLDKELAIIVEPGRSIAANAGILVTQVEYIKTTKHKNFAIVDAGMNDLLRPSLYKSYQEIIPVSCNSQEPTVFDIVGPICETGDFLGKDRSLSIKEGDLLAVRTAGAYGFTMSSNYNSRPRAAEVLVNKKSFHLIRRPETIEELYLQEKIPDLEHA